MRLRPLAVLMSVAVLSLGIGVAHATVLADLRFQTLRAASDLVVIAQVGGREVVATPPGTLTAHEVHTELAVERALVGRAPSTLVLRQLGDGASGAGEHIEDDACLRPGSRVLLFLPTREGPFVHLALLGFSAFDLLPSATGTLAVPQARLPHAPAPDTDVDVVQTLRVAAPSLWSPAARVDVDAPPRRGHVHAHRCEPRRAGRGGRRDAGPAAAERRRGRGRRGGVRLSRYP